MRDLMKMFEYNHLPEGRKKEARKNMFEKDQKLLEVGLRHPETFDYGVMLDFFTEEEYPYSKHRQSLLSDINKLKIKNTRIEIIEWMEAWLIMEDANMEDC